MILDTLENASLYDRLGPGFATPKGPCAVRKVVVKVDLARRDPA